MKIEAGKYYKTRDGEKVFILGRDPFNADGMIRIACVEIEINYLPGQGLETPA